MNTGDALGAKMGRVGGYAEAIVAMCWKACE